MVIRTIVTREILLIFLVYERHGYMYFLFRINIWLLFIIVIAMNYNYNIYKYNHDKLNTKYVVKSMGYEGEIP